MKTMCSYDMSWRTATKRSKLSRPVRWLLDNHLLVGRTLDYGCGRGDDADAMIYERYDPHFSPRMPDGEFDTILCNYVLNVIEISTTRLMIIWDIQSRLKTDGRAYISVRANRKVLKGLTSIGTWQGLIVLDLPIVFKDSNTIIYTLCKDDVVCTAHAETFGHNHTRS